MHPISVVYILRTTPRSGFAKWMSLTLEASGFDRQLFLLAARSAHNFGLDQYVIESA